MSSYIAKPSEIERKWYVLDAEGKTLGRLCTEAAMILRGKKKPTFTPFLDTGDYVIIINADKVQVTGKKAQKKIYKHHSGYPGGLREISFEKLQTKSAFFLTSSETPNAPPMMIIISFELLNCFSKS